MSEPILIYGDPASGKTTSLRNLDHKETFIISANIIDKGMSFPGWRKKYTPFHREKNPTGNYVRTTNPQTIVNLIEIIATTRPEIKILVIEDAQYIMSSECMNRALEKGYEKFTEVAKHFYDIIKATTCFGDYKSKVVFMGHAEEGIDGKAKFKTTGKMIDSLVRVEGAFSIVFYSFAKDGKFMFLTKDNGAAIARAPMNMFEDECIENDLNKIFKVIDKYNDVEFEDVPPMPKPKPKVEEKTK
jgi:hypothetical protein